MAFQDIKQVLLDLVAAKADEIYAQGLADAAQGGQIYTQEQLDQAVIAAKAEEKVAVKALVLGKFDAQVAAENDAEAQLRAEIEAL